MTPTHAYTYNPNCICAWCLNHGQQPKIDGGSTGHSWCYEEPHFPPVSVRTALTGHNTGNPASIQVTA